MKRESCYEDYVGETEVRQIPAFKQERKTNFESSNPSAVQENPLLTSMSETFSSCYNTAVKKNHDYGGSNNNPFANFLTSESITGVAAERGILVRLGDKFSRISTLLDKPGMVADESVDDTIMDAINYLAILKALRAHRKTTK